MGLYSGSVGGLDIAAIAEEMRLVEMAWFNSSIQIIDVHEAGGVYNPLTNTTVPANKAPTLVFSGKARVQPLRGPQDVDGAYMATSIRGVRIKMPLAVNLTPVLRPGLQVIVRNGGEDKSLELYSFVIGSGINSSYAWNRTIEGWVDLSAISDDVEEREALYPALTLYPSTTLFPRPV